jgi:hypothetical protein
MKKSKRKQSKTKWKEYQPTAYDLKRDPSLGRPVKKGFNWAKWNAEKYRKAREDDVVLAVLSDMRKEQP